MHLLYESKKGKKFEREAQLFRAAGIPAERNLEEVRSGNLGDIVLPRDVPLTKVKARLAEGRTVNELKSAVDGCLSNSFNVEGGFYDLELICRNDQKVTQYMQWDQKNRGRLPTWEDGLLREHG